MIQRKEKENILDGLIDIQRCNERLKEYFNFKQEGS